MPPPGPRFPAPHSPSGPVPAAGTASGETPKTPKPRFPRSSPGRRIRWPEWLVRRGRSVASRRTPVPPSSAASSCRARRGRSGRSAPGRGRPPPSRRGPPERGIRTTPAWRGPSPSRPPRRRRPGWSPSRTRETYPSSPPRGSPRPPRGTTGRTSSPCLPPRSPGSTPPAPPRCRGPPPGGAFGGIFLRPGPEGENPAVGHRLRRVQAQAHDHLFHLEDIREDRGNLPSKFEGHLHRRGKGRPEHRDLLLDDPVDRQELRSVFPLAGVRQQLPGEFGRPTSHPVDDGKISGRLLVPREQQGEHFRRPGDPQEQIVEFVGHPPRQHPDRLHFLALEDAAFHRVSLRDVP